MDSIQPQPNEVTAVPAAHGDRQPTSSDTTKTTTPARRAYKACLACRARKCKCDLGDIDAPSSPPCGRCRREGRECLFPEGRKGMRGMRSNSAAVMPSSIPSSARADSLDPVVRGIQPSGASAEPSLFNGRRLGDTVSVAHSPSIPSAVRGTRPHATAEDASRRVPTVSIIPEDSPMDEPTASGGGDVSSHDGLYDQIMSGTWPWPVQNSDEPTQGDTGQSKNTPADIPREHSPPSMQVAASLVRPFTAPTIHDPTPDDDSTPSYVLVDKGVIDWYHVLKLAFDYFRNIHLYMPFFAPDRIPTSHDDMISFAHREPHLLTAIIISGSKSQNSAFFKRVHDEAWLDMQATMNRVLQGSIVPDLGLIEGTLLLIDGLPRKEKHAQETHEDALRQRWMLLGFATRCSCQLGLHKNDLLKDKSAAYRERASVVWTYCFILETHLNIFVRHAVSTKISFPRTRTLSNQMGPLLAADSFPGLTAQKGSPRGSDHACTAQSMLDFSQYIGRVQDALYSGPDRFQERIESGEYFVTMNSLTEGLQVLEKLWSNKHWQDTRCGTMVDILVSAAKLYTFSASLFSDARSDRLHLEHIRPMGAGQPASSVAQSDQHLHLATSAATDLLRVATAEGHLSSGPPSLRLLDLVELGSVVLLEALQCGWRPREDTQQILFLIDKASELMLSKSTPSDPSVQTCGKAIASWKTSLATDFGERLENFPARPTAPQLSRATYRPYSLLDSGAFPRPSHDKQRDLGVRTTRFRSEEGRQGYDPYSRAPSTAAEHEAALVLEDLALSRGKNVERIMGEADPNLYGDLQIPLAPASDQSRNGLFTNFIDLSVLPDRQCSEFIIRYYISDVNWLMGCIHVPTFERECLAWWERPSTKVVVDDVEMAFLPLYTACLVLGLHLLSPSGLQSLGYTSEDRNQMCKESWQLGFNALQNSDWMQVHNLKSVQAIIIIGPYLVSMWRSEFHWTLLGSAIKVAQNLRLSRLGPEPSEGASRETIRKMYGSRWVEAADREVARRVWWCLVELDWTFAAEHEFNAIIFGDFVTCLPANVSDSDLCGHGPVISKPMTVRTPMSYFLNRIELFRPIRDLLETSYRRGKFVYTSVMKAHEAISRNIAQASPFYLDDADISDYVTDAEDMRRCDIERNAFHRSADLRLVRLHRFHSSLADRLPKYTFSRKICVQAAKNLITRTLEPFESPSNYWLTTYSLFTSCVVLLLETTHASRQQAVELRGSVQMGIARLRANTEATGKATAADYLQQLLTAEGQLEASTPDSTGSKKRSRPGEEGEASSLSRLIKKVRSQETGQSLDSTDAADFFNFNLPSYAGVGLWPVELSDGNEFADQYLSGMQDPNVFDLVQLMMGDTYLDFGQTDMELNLG